MIMLVGFYVKSSSGCKVLTVGHFLVTGSRRPCRDDGGRYSARDGGIQGQGGRRALGHDAFLLYVIILS